MINKIEYITPYSLRQLYLNFKLKRNLKKDSNKK